MRCWGVRRRVDCIAAVRWECARASPRDGPCRSPPSTLRPCLETPSSALILSPCAGSASMEPKDPELSEPEAGMASDPREAPAALSGADVQGLGAGGEPGTMNQDTEVDMKEVELNELEPEKQPMNAASEAAVAGGAEKNGLVKIKVAEDEAEAAPGAKFTGLSKEELLKVAGSPGWVRTRWALLLLFWLGWLGMLAGAVVIIVRAPRCRELPAQHWWHRGALYRVGDLQAFQARDSGDLAGLKDRLDYLSSLKVKGLVLGPIHKNQKDDVEGTELKAIDPALGSREDFDSLLLAANKKSIHVILDLTPNYLGENSWFLPTQVDVVAAKMKEALDFWLKAGVYGFQVRDVENLTNAASHLADWQNITKSFKEDRLLLVGTGSSGLRPTLDLLESTKDLLLTSSYLASSAFTAEDTKLLVTQYLNATDSHWCSWSLSQAGLLTSFVPAQLLRLYQLLLFTLPGTPVFSYGDEIGLQATLPGQPAKAPVMLWDEASLPSASVGANMTVKGQNQDPNSVLSLFRRLSDQRGKERSLLHGDFHVLSTGYSLFSYVRHWDQNDRFLVVLNFGDVGLSARLGSSNLPASASLPAEANLLLSTHPDREEGTALALEQLHLEPHEGLLLRFPYVA